MRPVRAGLSAGCLSAALFLGVSTARADGGEQPASMPLDERRYELAGFPIVGGNSDIGVQFGGAATLTRFYDSAFPYLWNIDLLLSASVKDANGFNLVQQSHVLRLDAPDLWSGRLRLDSRASYQRTINMGYYGLGNAQRVDLTPPPGEPNIGKRYWYLQDEGRLRTIARFHTVTRLDIVVGGSLRYEAPQAYPRDQGYPPSQLAIDLAARNPDGSPVAVGGQPALLAGVAAGIMIDTRDSEFVTRNGFFYQIGLGATVGSAEQVAYGNASAVLEHFAPLGGPFVFASRFVASFQFGRVPFYDLAQGGTFEPQYMLGGETGVRGVPIGRYAGPIKMMANTEIRATPFPRFTLWGQRLRIGATVFFDAGRVWNQYSFTSAADGNSLWLKYGIGGGVFLQWGEAAIFRVEVAYSPDAESENPGLPLGIYVADGLQF